MLKALGFGKKSALSDDLDGSLKRSESAVSLSALNQALSLEDALHAMDLVMDDQTARAQTILHASSSAASSSSAAYVNLASGVVDFLQATLGFEPEAVSRAADTLSLAETTSLKARQRAEKYHMATSQHYPPGLEFQLTYAESQLMGAICMFLSEGVIDAAKGLLKLRKAFLTLDEISQKIKASKAQTTARTNPSRKDPETASTTSNSSDTNSRLDMDTLGHDFDALGLQLSDDQEVNVRAEELYLARLRRKLGAVGTVEQAKRLLIEARGVVSDDVDSLSNSNPSSSTVTLSSVKSVKSITSTTPTLPTIPTTTLSTDEFIESGVNLCYGVLQLIISVIPPSLSSALSFVGFHGTKVDGLKMLWKATEYRNIHSAIATLVLLSFYDGPTQLSDITLEDEAGKIDNEVITATGHPVGRINRVLKQAREDFPNSALWLLQEARALASQGHLPEAISLLDTIDSTQIEMRQVEALLLFDKTMMTIFLHDYEAASANFIRLIAINSWSHALYTYIAGTCLVEAYRAHKVSGDTVKAADAKRRAKEYIEKAPTLMGKKRFMAKTMPFDVFLTRKVKQWRSVAQARGIDLIDAIGTSPIHEIIYFWNGFKSMPGAALDKSLDLLNYSTSVEAQKLVPESADEALIRHTLTSIVLRSYKSNQPERTLEALKVLDSKVLPHIMTKSSSGSIVYNKNHVDPWVGPVSIYERAVFEWKLKGRKGIKEVKYYLSAANNWADDYELSTRVGMRIKSATERIDSM